jgi:hypothetical protein
MLSTVSSGRMAIDQPTHHVGLARGAKRGALFLGLLDLDQTIDDLAALDQKAMHRRVDAVDVTSQIRQ